MNSNDNRQKLYQQYINMLESKGEVHFSHCIDLYVNNYNLYTLPTTTLASAEWMAQLWLEGRDVADKHKRYGVVIEAIPSSAYKAQMYVLRFMTRETEEHKSWATVSTVAEAVGTKWLRGKSNRSLLVTMPIFWGQTNTGPTVDIKDNRVVRAYNEESIKGGINVKLCR